MAKLNSRWHAPTKVTAVPRLNPKGTVEQTRWVRQPNGARRKETDSPTEAKYCERVREGAGWHRGARVSKR